MKITYYVLKDGIILTAV